jgi:deoxyribodipyrimidine photo-lyase
MRELRYRELAPGMRRTGPVVYWMSRDQRPDDHWGLTIAQDTAIERGQPLWVVFCLLDRFLGAPWRAYHFMLTGLAETEKALQQKRIGFRVFQGRAPETLPTFLEDTKASLLVTDFSPLRDHRQDLTTLVERVRCPVWQVDAHNVVPCWVASKKQEWSATTIRRKIHRFLPDFLSEPPALKRHPFPVPAPSAGDLWAQAAADLPLDRSVGPVEWLKPGPKAAQAMLGRFLRDRLGRYHLERNDPNGDTESDLSPFLHFGQLSAQRAAWAVHTAEDAPTEAKEAFLEQIIVRRELADNFCANNDAYDRVEGFPRWARDTLAAHTADPRPYLYDDAVFEHGQTHDDLWNAAQRQMVARGKMHNYLRMYWAKKILEWTPSAADALRVILWLNDRYELDGRDPNGFVGAAWSVGGLHDRPWAERPIFGMIRFMNRAGCERKFDVPAFIRAFYNPSTQR